MPPIPPLGGRNQSLKEIMLRKIGIVYEDRQLKDIALVHYVRWFKLSGDGNANLSAPLIAERETCG